MNIQTSALTMGFSSCPNDTFIFDAVIHGRVDSRGLAFQTELGDVEKLNRLAFQGALDITKLSYHAFAHVADKYQLLHAGSALGNDCGPLLIARQPMSAAEIQQARIAIPGKYTTANFLLGFAYPQVGEKIEMVFSAIEDAVLSGQVDAGLIIHENRFTYESKGLVRLVDLGAIWEQKTGFPIPLGGIAIRRNISTEIKRKVDEALRASIEFAFAHPEASMPFVREHAQEMEDSVMKQHINLYVNQYSIDLGEKGMMAVRHLYEQGAALGLFPPVPEPLFV